MAHESQQTKLNSSAYKTKPKHLPAFELSHNNMYVDIRGRMHNNIVNTTSKLKSIYNDIASKSVCTTKS